MKVYLILPSHGYNKTNILRDINFTGNLRLEIDGDIVDMSPIWLSKKSTHKDYLALVKKTHDWINYMVSETVSENTISDLIIRLNNSLFYRWPKITKIDLYHTEVCIFQKSTVFNKKPIELTIKHLFDQRNYGSDEQLHKKITAFLQHWGSTIPKENNGLQ